MRSDYGKTWTDKTGRFPGGQCHGQDQGSGRIGEISNLFDILPTQHDKPGNYNQP